ncbi:hypothetical protein, conserved [Eimeria necatrix]|uniref:EF-hand domain-containing protein n=1 Tax=Eimeria necatrix TaxID=51315 RepID=U6MT64_9EIME|nr:hypothetical protein, conserved [Eimeria necatrix]CDJ64860.1 hypothetical protein, conserved [Eimeria necatrix]
MERAAQSSGRLLLAPSVLLARALQRAAAATAAATAAAAAASSPCLHSFARESTQANVRYRLPEPSRGGPLGPPGAPQSLPAGRGALWRGRGGPPGGPPFEGHRLFSRAAAAKIAGEGPPEGSGGPPAGSGAPSAKFQTLSDLLQQENSLSGLFESYNNERSLGSLLTLQQLQQQMERVGRLEREAVLRRGLSQQMARQVSVQGLRPSLGNRIPFNDFVSAAAAAAWAEAAAARASSAAAARLLRRLPLSQAAKALVSSSTTLYFNINEFCEALQPLLLQQGAPQQQTGGPPAAADAPELRDPQLVRAALEEAFEAVQGSRSGIADALELLSGLCRFCKADEDERVKASFVLLDKEGRGLLDFFVVAAVFHHLHRMLLTPSIVDKLRRARVSFKSVDDLALASAVELFKDKYPFVTMALEGCCGLQGRAAAEAAAAAPAAASAAATQAAAAATECARKQLYVDPTEEPWKTLSRHAGLTLTFDEFERECKDTPNEATLSATSLLRLPLIVVLRDLF